MTRTSNTYSLMGEDAYIHICDWCEESTDDGRGYLYWEEKDFTLCRYCCIKAAEHFSGRLQRKSGIGAEYSVPPKATVPEDLRWRVYQRDNFTCRYCGARQYLTIDHVVPESVGGPTAADNLVTACKHCNSRKGARTPEEADMPLRPLPGATE